MSIGKNGIWKSNNFSNYSYRAIAPIKTIQEPDGSQWLQIFHHNYPANYLFSSTDTFINGIYKDSNRWFNMNACNAFTKWEFLIKQQLTDSSTEIKYRWIQSANPMTCAFGDVDAADITPVTTTGYTTMGSGYGGFWKKNNATYLAQNDGKSSDWWGAVGAWQNYQSGIPAINGQVVTSGYLDVYIRIDNDSLSITDKTKIFNNQDLIGNDFIEI